MISYLKVMPSLAKWSLAWAQVRPERLLIEALILKAVDSIAIKEIKYSSRLIYPKSIG